MSNQDPTSTTHDDLSPSFLATLLLTLAAIGSLVFLLLPGSSGSLYITQHVGFTCISYNEWTWVCLTSLCVSLPSWIPSRKATEYILTTSQCCLSFVALNVLWMATAMYPLEDHWRDYSFVDWMGLGGAKAAWPAMWNMAVVILPVQRTSQLLQFLGISHSEANEFHRWAGHATLLWLSLHTVLLTAVYLVRTDNLHEFFSLMLPYQKLYSEGVVNFCGWVAFDAFLGLWITSQPSFRRRHFEVFRLLHFVLSALFVAFSNFHDYATFFFIQPAFVGWVADRIQRRNGCQTLVIDRDASEAMTLSTTAHAPVVALTLPIPSSWPMLEPGSYVYIQSHPFSVSSIDRDGRTFTLHIKALGDWTTEFVNDIHDLMDQEDESSNSDETSAIAWELEGPYGGSALHKTLEEYTHCLFVAGGIGLTGVAALAGSRQGGTSTVALYVRTQGEICALTPLLERLQRLWHTKLLIYRTHDDDNPSSDDSRHRSYHVRYTESFPGNQSWIILLVAVVGSILSFVIARFTFCYKPGTDHGQHECSALFASFTCQQCGIDTSKDSQLPCCTVPVCFFCFRGAPLILSFLFVPPWTHAVSRWAIQRWRKRRAPLYRPTHVEDLLETIEPRPEPLEDCSTELAVEERRADIAELLAAHLKADTAIVACGPESLIRNVREQARQHQVRVFSLPWNT